MIRESAAIQAARRIAAVLAPGSDQAAELIASIILAADKEADARVVVAMPARDVAHEVEGT